MEYYLESIYYQYYPYCWKCFGLEPGFILNSHILLCTI